MENRKEKLVARLQKAIDEKVFPGCVLGIVTKNGKREIYPVGRFTYDPDSSPMKEDSMFDVASVTKLIPAAYSLLKLIDEGKVRLEDRLVDYLPEFGNFSNKSEVLIKHILNYTLNLVIPSTTSMKDMSPDEIVNTIIKAPLRNPPGSEFFYNNATALFAGLIVQKITGQKLDEYADQAFFKPLGMTRTTFHPELFSKNEIVPTERDEWRGRLLQGEVHDEATFTLQKKYILGSAGLFSTVPDLLTFQEMLLKKGGSGHISKTGFTGCLVFTDFDKGIGFTLLSNRIYPKRPFDNSRINEVRKDITDTILAL